MENKIDVHAIGDLRGIKIDKVGIEKLKLPIRFKNKNTINNSIANIDAYVMLQSNTKGAHLSRIVIELNKLCNRDIELQDIEEILISMVKACESEDGEIRLSFEHTYKTLSPVTKNECIMTANVEINLTYELGNLYKKIKVFINGMALCPASKKISLYNAHSQRCQIAGTISQYDRQIDIEKVINILSLSCSSPVYSVIKREDEKYITEKAYENAKFSEDIIRDGLIKLKQYTPKNNIIMEIWNYESIHQHNVYAKGEL